MSEKTNTHLIWEGQASLGKLHELIQTRQNFELQLPPDYHYTLARHLYPGEAAADPGLVDLDGTAELLKNVAQISGLEQLSELIEPIKAAQAKVRIQSPAPGILVFFR